MNTSSHPRRPVTADDVDAAVGAAVTALSTIRGDAWSVLAYGLEWTCWETVEHICDDLFAYAGQIAPRTPPTTTHVPFAFYAKRAGGPKSSIFVEADAGTDGLLQVLDACGAFLSALVRTTAPQVRAHHIFGVSDPEGFAAMGILETLVHTYDVTRALDLRWAPDVDLCDRVLRRLFRDAPLDTPRWQTVLWCTGRGPLEGREPLTRWRWFGEPLPASDGDHADV
jgi:hypothetical protein